MKKRNKLLTLLLCAALITATLPIGTPVVYAAGEAAGTPSRTAYASQGDLRTNYDLRKDTNEAQKSVQRVFFGKDGNGNQQKWKIVGEDNEIKDGDGNTIDNIVLFADSAITGITTPNDKIERQKIKFEENWTSGSTEKTTKEDDLKKSGITYKDDNYPSTVNFNHYGTSTLRDVLKGMLKDSQGNMVTKYFTAAQQKLMNETTITTKDTKNNVNYTTTDILYAPYGYFDPLSFDTNPKGQYVTVGTNKEIDGSLNDGLKIDRQINGVNLWESSSPPNTFWLRAPNDFMGILALVAAPGAYVSTGSVGDGYSVVPAFDLNLTDVLFASKATAATQSTDAKIDEKDTMTLRWKDTGNKIKSTATATKKTVNLTKNDGANEVYLCVQGNNDGTDWIWSKKVSEISGNKVTAQTIANDIKTSKALTDTTALDLTTCQIWLETTTDGLTYAKQAQTGYSVSITAGTGLEITSNNATQTVNNGTDIGAITVTVDSGYYVSDDYISNMNRDTALLGSSGLTARKTGAGFTITGKPTKDVNITLPAATAKTKAEKPTLSAGNIKRTKNSLTVTGNFNTAAYGAIQYRYKQAGASDWAVDWTEGTEISGLQAGTKYTVAIRYKGKDSYSPSDPAELTISTLEDTSSTGTTTPDTDKTYDSNKDGGQAGSKSDPEGSASVQTGDESSPALWIALMLIALAAAGGTVSCGRRKRAR